MTMRLGTTAAISPPTSDRRRGGTHIALFLVWAVRNGLGNALHVGDPATMAMLRDRTIDPCAWFMAACDEKLTDEDLNEEGNLFASAYYENRPESGPSGSYFSDYEGVFPESDSLYDVPDTWDSYDRIAPLLDRRLAQWRRSRAGWRAKLGRLFGRRQD